MTGQAKQVKADLSNIRPWSWSFVRGTPAQILRVAQAVHAEIQASGAGIEWVVAEASTLMSPRAGEVNVCQGKSGWQLSARFEWPWEVTIPFESHLPDAPLATRVESICEAQVQLVFAVSALPFREQTAGRQQVLNLLFHLEVNLATLDEELHGEHASLMSYESRLRPVLEAARGTSIWALLELWKHHGFFADLQRAGEVLRSAYTATACATAPMNVERVLRVEQAIVDSDESTLQSQIDILEAAYPSLSPWQDRELEVVESWVLSLHQKAACAMARRRGDIEDWTRALTASERWQIKAMDSADPMLVDQALWTSAEMHADAGYELRELGWLHAAVALCEQALQTPLTKIIESKRPMRYSMHSEVDWLVARARAWQRLATISGDDLQRVVAIQMVEACWLVVTVEHKSLWGDVHHSLGELKCQQGVAQKKLTLITEAISHFQVALDARDLILEPQKWAITQQALGRAHMAHHSVSNDADDLRQALEALLPALALVDAEGHAHEAALIRADVARVWSELAGAAVDEPLLVRAQREGRRAWRALAELGESAHVAARAELAHTLRNTAEALASIDAKAHPWADVVGAFEREHRYRDDPDGAEDAAVFLLAWTHALVCASRQTADSAPLQRALALLNGDGVGAMSDTGVVHAKRIAFEQAAVQIELGSAFNEMSELDAGRSALQSLLDSCAHVTPSANSVGLPLSADDLALHWAWLIEAQMVLALTQGHSLELQFQQRVGQIKNSLDRQNHPKVWAWVATCAAMLDWHQSVPMSDNERVAQATTLATLRVLSHHCAVTARRLEAWMRRLQWQKAQAHCVAGGV